MLLVVFVKNPVWTGCQPVGSWHKQTSEDQLKFLFANLASGGTDAFDP